MNIFGLLSLVVVIIVAVGVWWGSSRLAPMAPAEESAQRNQAAVDSPQTVAEPVSVGSVEVYTGISVAKNTQELDLSGRGLEGSLKAEVRQLSELRNLDISGNNFTGLPAEIGQLTKLENLNLANNPLTGLPHELANLHNLQILDLRGTNYAESDLTIIKQGLPATVQILTE